MPSSSLVAPVDGQVTRSRDLAEMSLADAPSYSVAVAAGLAHGLAPEDALDAAFGKYMTEHADAVQAFGLANFYDGKNADHAFANYSRMLRFLLITVADLKSQVATLTAEVSSRSHRITAG